MTLQDPAAAAPGLPFGSILTATRTAAPVVGDGALLAFFIDGSAQIIFQVALDEGTRHVDELFLRHLGALVADIDAATVVLASVRGSGRPRRVDRLLFQEMQRRLSGAHSELADLLVVGADRCWSAATRRRVG